jgi:uncharacterized membrane protein
VRRQLAWQALLLLLLLLLLPLLSGALAALPLLAHAVRCAVACAALALWLGARCHHIYHDIDHIIYD